MERFYDVDQSTVEKQVVVVINGAKAASRLSKENPRLLAEYLGDLMAAKLDIEAALENIDHDVFPFIEFPR